MVEDEKMVAALYRGLLGREPDDDGLVHYVEELRQHNDHDRVVRSFVESPEFRGRCQTGELMYALDRAPPMPVQTVCTEAQRKAIWKHIGEAWSALGNTDPYWSVLTDDRWRQPNMTDKGVIDAFYATGNGDIERLVAWLERNGIVLPPSAVCAEYGCGLGRITRLLARRFGG